MSHKIKLLSLVIFATFISLYLNIYKTTLKKRAIISNQIIGDNNYIPKIYCMIIINKENVKEKGKLIYESWASLCDSYQFISLISDDIKTKNQSEIDLNGIKVVQPPGLDQDTYDSLTEKVFYAFKYVYEKYNNYDWYLKVDEDTFIFVNNLRNFLKTKNPNDPVTFGYDYKVYVDSGYHSGGAGYVLSKEALTRLGKKLNEDFSFCPNSGSEDVDIAECLRMLNVYPEKSIDDFGRERFHPLDLVSHYEGDIPDWLLEYASNPVKNVTII